LSSRFFLFLQLSGARQTTKLIYGIKNAYFLAVRRQILSFARKAKAQSTSSCARKIRREAKKTRRWRIGFGCGGFRVRVRGGKFFSQQPKERRIIHIFSTVLATKWLSYVHR